MHHEQAQALVGLALASGGRKTSPTVTEWDVSGNCLFPVCRELHVRPSPAHRSPVVSFLEEIKKHFGSTGEVDLRAYKAKHASKYIRVHAGPQVPLEQRTAVPLTLRLTVRCRKCDRCLQLRGLQWAERTLVELQDAPRTWFGTLTLRPESHYMSYVAARARLAHQGVDFDALPYGEQFVERHRQINVEITKYLKRVRKQSGAFRYLLVAEHHKSGLPHYHALLHEREEGSVKYEVLSGQWKLGFEKWRLASADKSQAWYLCKYLAKASVARVRASVSYGKERTVQQDSVENYIPDSLSGWSLSLSSRKGLDTLVVASEASVDAIEGERPPPGKNET